jgi:hypothetical protein
MIRPREYLKLTKRCRALKDEARDVVSRSDLATLEYSYLTLAESVRVLRRSNRVHKKLERHLISAAQRLEHSLEVRLEDSVVWIAISNRLHPKHSKGVSLHPLKIADAQVPLIRDLTEPAVSHVGGLFPLRLASYFGRPLLLGAMRRRRLPLKREREWAAKPPVIDYQAICDEIHRTKARH